jgi:2-keto-4-pentenoate hydratase
MTKVMMMTMMIANEIYDLGFYIWESKVKKSNLELNEMRQERRRNIAVEASLFNNKQLQHPLRLLIVFSPLLCNFTSFSLLKFLF